MTIVAFEGQQNFPNVDLSEPNAELLELLLLREATLHESHNAAETYWIYRLGHHSLRTAAGVQIEETKASKAFSTGVAIFEIVASIVRPPSPLTNAIKPVVNRGIMTAHETLRDRFVPTVSAAREKLDSLPRFRSIVGQSALRFYPDHTDYSLAGAAVALQLQLDVDVITA